jgi:hypothetical protein
VEVSAELQKKSFLLPAIGRGVTTAQFGDLLVVQRKLVVDFPGSGIMAGW